MKHFIGSVGVKATDVYVSDSQIIAQALFKGSTSTTRAEWRRNSHRDGRILQSDGVEVRIYVLAVRGDKNLGRNVCLN